MSACGPTIWIGGERWLAVFMYLAMTVICCLDARSKRQRSRIKAR